MKHLALVIALLMFASCANDPETSAPQTQTWRPPALGSTFRVETGNGIPPSIYTVTKMHPSSGERDSIYEVLSDVNPYVNWLIDYEANGDVSLALYGESRWFRLPIVSRQEQTSRDSSSNGTNNYSIRNTRIRAEHGDSVTIQGKRYSTVVSRITSIRDTYYNGNISQSDTSNDSYHWSPEIGFYTRREWKNSTIVDSLVEFMKK